MFRSLTSLRMLANKGYHPRNTIFRYQIGFVGARYIVPLRHISAQLMGEPKRDKLSLRIALLLKTVLH